VEQDPLVFILTKWNSRIKLIKIINTRQEEWALQRICL